jgi:hypothetical protein
LPLVPAKAGIQGDKFDALIMLLWIPAYAGMSGCGHPIFFNSRTTVARSPSSSGASVAAVISAATSMAFSVTARPRSVSVTAAATILWIGRRRQKAAHGQAVDHALDGRGVEKNVAAEMVLRTGTDVVQFGERGELGLRPAPGKTMAQFEFRREPCFCVRF